MSKKAKIAVCLVMAAICAALGAWWVYHLYKEVFTALVVFGVYTVLLYMAFLSIDMMRWQKKKGEGYTLGYSVSAIVTVTAVLYIGYNMKNDNYSSNILPAIICGLAFLATITFWINTARHDKRSE